MNELISRKSAKHAIYKICLDEGNKDIFVKILDEINKLSFIEQESSGDLISRQSVLNACEQSINILEAVDRIMDLPSVEQEPCSNCCNGNQIEKAKLCQKSYLAGMEHKQEPKTGHWDRRTCKCSECGYQITFSEYTEHKYKYCPNCGCRMVEPQERSE